MVQFPRAKMGRTAGRAKNMVGAGVGQRMFRKARKPVRVRTTSMGFSRERSQALTVRL